MIRRILVGAADSPEGLAAARAAVELADACGASLRAIHVLTDGAIDAALTAASAEARVSGSAALAERREQAADAVLRHVAALARRVAVPVEVAQRWGDVAACLLDEADRWPADLIVVGRADRSARHRPNLDGDLQRVLEFTNQPVLVVPAGVGPWTLDRGTGAESDERSGTERDRGGATMKAKRWTVDVFIDEDEGRTHARAHLHTGVEPGLTGVGLAKLNPEDLDVPEIGDELAVARALTDLGQKLLVTAARDIESITKEPARLHA